MSKPALVATVATALLLSAPMLLAPTTASASPAEQAAEEPASVRVVVDAKSLGDAAPFFEDEVGARMRTALGEAGYEVVDKADADVTVRVRMAFFNEADLDYVIDVDISTGAEIVRLETVACPQCVDGDLLAKVEEHGDAVAEGVGKALAQRGDGPGEREPGEGNQTEAGQPVKPLTQLGGWGIGVATAGLGVTIFGAVELARGRVYDDGGDPGFNIQRNWTDYRPRGRVWLGVGVGAVAVGGALLVTDLVLQAKKRKRANQQIGAFAPMLSPQAIGVGWKRRF